MKLDNLVLSVQFSFRYDANELQGSGPGLESMHLTRRDQYGVARLDGLFTLLVANFTLSLEDVNLMLPIVFVIRSEASSFNCKMAHDEIRGTIFFVDKPLDLRIFRALFSDGSIRNGFHVHLVQCQSQYLLRVRKISCALCFALSELEDFDL